MGLHSEQFEGQQATPPESAQKVAAAGTAPGPQQCSQGLLVMTAGWEQIPKRGCTALQAESVCAYYKGLRSSLMCRAGTAPLLAPKSVGESTNLI